MNCNWCKDKVNEILNCSLKYGEGIDIELNTVDNALHIDGVYDIGYGAIEGVILPIKHCPKCGRKL